MPPARVPWLFLTRLLAISRLWAHRVNKDAASTLGAVGHRQTVNARRIALEAAGERILTISVTVTAAAVLRSVLQERGAIREGSRLRTERIRPGSEHPLANTVIPAPSYAPISDRLLQLFRQVAVQRRVPADSRLRRQTVHLRIEFVRAVKPTASPVSAAGVLSSARTNHFRQSEQANDAFAPAGQNVGGMRIGIDDAGRSSDTLQPDRLPHHQQLMVDTCAAR